MSEPSEPRVYRQHRFERPPGATELLLVRHGESAPAVIGEPFRLVDGQGDPDLAPEGRVQAERVADRLEHEDIDALYVTTLCRTVQTAEPLAKRLGMEPRVEPDLREVHLGEWEGGLFRQHVVEGHPLPLKMMAEERWEVIPGAEPAAAFSARIVAAVERIAAAHPDQRVAVFSHGGAIGQVLSHATGARPFAFNGSDNGSIAHVVVWGDRWILRRYNDTAHLDSHFSLRPAPLT